MSPILKSFGIDRLDRDQRLVLVQEIWDSIAAEQTPALLTENQRRELERRLEDDETSPDDVIPWEQVKAQTLARWPGANG